MSKTIEIDGITYQKDTDFTNLEGLNRRYVLLEDRLHVVNGFDYKMYKAKSVDMVTIEYVRLSTPEKERAGVNVAMKADRYSWWDRVEKATKIAEDVDFFREEIEKRKKKDEVKVPKKLSIKILEKHLIDSTMTIKDLLNDSALVPVLEAMEEYKQS